MNQHEAEKQQKSEAIEAERLLESPIIQRFFSDARKQLVEQIAIEATGDMVRLKELAVLLSNLDAFHKFLRHVVITGQVVFDKEQRKERAAKTAGRYGRK